ncbi:hypothetical protein A8C56_21055 [Niabella ginsenosidivorans]|uniref:DUF2490 domain-containing protein n=1 Tax=Niabella ginsenosidivorans TaxID=1176587 RepID=A0A1A9I617_9BACT|nr:DUF2490 domain-containing protein [Niabella ginsenosidivorans]ANH83137.1 hypothetical protein A8C56_21055 [Niabella ginsenosidivorans]
MIRRLLLPAFLLVLIDFCHAQTGPEHLSGFLTTSITYKYAPKWMAYMEMQARSIEQFKTIDYYEIKGGTGYNFNENSQALIGIGRYATYKQKSLSQEELRLWLQYTFSHAVSRIDFDHRLRAEQRFFHQLKTAQRTNDQRYRYRLSATIPVNKKRVIAKTFFVNAFNELFLGPKENAFKRNRVYSGAGYQFNGNIGMTAGYLWQRELSPVGNRSLHFIQLAANIVIDRWADKDKRIFVPVID